MLILALVNFGSVRQALSWHLTYLSNFYFVMSHDYGRVGIFWTLAVEEQFYLVWPCLILFAPRRGLFPVVIGVVASAGVYRLAASVLWPSHWWARWILPFACFDTLGDGALLALVTSGTPFERSWKPVLRRLSLVVGGPLFLLTLVLFVLHCLPDGFYVLFFRFVCAMFFFWLIDQADRGFAGPVGRVLEAPPLLWIGKISYGLYIIHYFVLALLAYIVPASLLPEQSQVILRFVLLSTVSVCLAAVSWCAFEKPINDLKRYFPYSVPRPCPVPSVEECVVQPSCETLSPQL